MKLVLMLFLYCLCFNLHSQNNLKYFEKKFGWTFVQSAQNIIALDTGYAISVGYFVSSDLFHHARFLTISDIAEEITSFDLNNAYYSLSDLIKTPDNGYALVGFKSNCDTCFGPYHTYLHLLDENGNSISQYNIGANGFESGGGVICYSDIEYSYYVAGNYIPTFITPNREKLYLTKVTTEGEKLWEYTNWMYPYNCSFRAVLPAPDGGCYAAGYVNVHAPSLGDFLFLKLNANGILDWEKVYSFNTGNGGAAALGLAATIDNGFVLCGSSNYGNARLLKTDVMGDSIWSREYFPNEQISSFLTVTVLPDNAIVCIGSIKSYGVSGTDMLIAKVDSVGNLMWVRKYGSPMYHDYGYDFTPVPQPLGGFVVVGRAENSTNALAYIVKTNCMGLLTVPQAAFAISQDPDLPSHFLFTNQSQYTYPDSIDGGYYVLNWGDGSPPFLCGQGYAPCTQDTLIHTYQTEGIYGVTLQAIVCNDTSTQIQSVCFGFAPNPQAEFSYQDFGGSIIFTNLSQNSYTEQGGYYVWDFGDGSPPSSAEHPTHEYEENGSYTVTLTLVVCADTSVYTQEVVVQTVGISPPGLSPPEPLKGEKTIHIYPNPAQNTLTFTLPESLTEAV
ncbi:MAG: PKD domain-containing protein [Sphingobacteriales bacterium]|nr:MAG: PKD domain-containing protein [Sphingobacteriales bacterium]